VSIRRSYGWLFAYAREPAAGIEHIRRAIVMNPEQSETHLLLGLLLLQAGLLDDAEQSVREALALAPDDTHALAVLGRLRVQQGRRAEAEAIRDQMHALEADRYVSPTDLARIHLALDERDAAFAMLDRAWAERRGWLAYLRVDPLFDAVREDSRFRAWLERMRLA
jgi:Flp pilus assembly protein TadD